MQTTYLLTYSDSGSTDSGNPLFGHGILENQIQALSKTFRHRFKDFQGSCLFSRTFQALKIWKKIQRLSRMHKIHVFRVEQKLTTNDLINH